ncbi:hypothetical protein PIROE2DRAFT_10439, partial [Piromyces sp. E2]
KPSKLEELIELRKIDVDGEKVKCKEITEETFKEKVDFINKSNNYRYSNNDKYNEKMKNNEIKQNQKDGNTKNSNPTNAKDNSNKNNDTIKNNISKNDDTTKKNNSENSVKTTTKEPEKKKKTTTRKRTTAKSTKKTKKTTENSTGEIQNLKYDLINELHDYSYNVFSPNKEVLNNHTQYSLFIKTNKENEINTSMQETPKIVTTEVSSIPTTEFMYSPVAINQVTNKINSTLPTTVLEKNKIANTPPSGVGIKLSQIEVTNNGDLTNTTTKTTIPTVTSASEDLVSKETIIPKKNSSQVKEIITTNNIVKIEKTPTPIIPSNVLALNSNPDLLSTSNGIPNTTAGVGFDLKKPFALNSNDVNINSLKPTPQQPLPLNLTKPSPFLNGNFYMNSIYTEFSPTNEKNYISIFGDEEEDESPFKPNINLNNIDTNDLSLLQNNINLSSLNNPANTPNQVLISPTTTNFPIPPLNTTNITIPGAPPLKSPIPASNIPVAPVPPVTPVAPVAPVAPVVPLNTSNLPISGPMLSSPSPSAIPSGKIYRSSSSLPNSNLNSPTTNIPIHSLSTNTSPIQQQQPPKATSLSNIPFNQVPTLPSHPQRNTIPPPSALNSQVSKLALSPPNNLFNRSLNQISPTLPTNPQQTQLTRPNPIQPINLTQSSLAMSLTKPRINTLMEEPYEEMPTMDTIPKLNEMKRKSTDLNYSSFSTTPQDPVNLGLNMNMGMNIGININMQRTMNGALPPPPPQAQAPPPPQPSLPLINMSNANANTYTLSNANSVSSLPLIVVCMVYAREKKKEKEEERKGEGEGREKKKIKMIKKKEKKKRRKK